MNESKNFETLELCSTSKDKTMDERMKNDIQENKYLAVFCYFYLFSLIPACINPKSNYIRFHLNQGLSLMLVNLMLFFIYIIITFIQLVFATIFGFFKVLGLFAILRLSTIFWLLQFILIIFGILGIFYAFSGKMKKLPIVGRIKLIKI